MYYFFYIKFLKKVFYLFLFLLFISYFFYPFIALSNTDTSSDTDNDTESTNFDITYQLNPMNKTSADYGVPEDFINKLKNNTHSFYLNNQIKVVHYQSTHNNVAIKFSLDWDSYDYFNEWELIRPFFAKLMTKQTQDYLKNQINKITNRKIYRLSCSPRNSCYQGGKLSCEIFFPRENSNSALNLFKSIITKPKIDKIDLEVTKKNSLIEYKNCRIDNRWQTYKSHFRMIFSPISYLKTYYNLEPFIKKITTERLIKEYKKFFNASRMHFTVVGSFNKDTVKKDFNELFNDIPSWHYKKPTKISQNKWSYPSYQDNDRIVINNQDIQTIFVKIVTHSSGSYSAHYNGLNLLFYIFNEHFTKAMRENKGLSYNAYAYFNGGIGEFGFSTSQLDEAMDVTKEFFEKIKHDPLQGENLEHFKTNFIVNFYRNLSSPLAIARTLSYHDTNFHSLHRYYDYPDNVAKISSEYLNFLTKEVMKDFSFSIRGTKSQIEDHKKFYDYFDPKPFKSFP